MERVKFLKPFGTPEAPEIWGALGAQNLVFFYHRRWRRKLPPRMGRPWRPNFFTLVFFSHRRLRRRSPKGGAEGATPPEGEGNPAEGGYFTSI